jgi:hypothetical protein
VSGYGEAELVRKLNLKFEIEGIIAHAYRNPQLRRRAQNCDISVDSMNRKWFLAIEVKAIKKGEYLNFKKFFTTDKYGVHQLERLCTFALECDRIPIVVLFVRNGRKKRGIYTFDAFELNALRIKGKKSLKPSEFDEYDTGWHMGVI